MYPPAAPSVPAEPHYASPRGRHRGPCEREWRPESRAGVSDRSGNRGDRRGHRAAGRWEESGTIAVRALGLTFLLVVACGGNPLPDWKVSPTTSPNAKRIDHLHRVLNNHAWQRSPYSRPDDILDTPIYLFIAGDPPACIVPATDSTIAA